ncbi:MAG: radical SAM protein [Candidatus Thorarchaeota archaeon]
MRYETVNAKSLLSKPIYGDSWFHINRSINSYRGCEFGCNYCDGRSEYYHVDDFDSHIRIKQNAPEVLRKELEKEGFVSRSKLETETLWAFLEDEDAKRLALKTPRRQVIGVCGGVSDGYQQAEETHCVTRRNLEVLLDFELPVFILTKSKLVLRDLDLLKKIHEVAFANIDFTITLHDPEVKSAFEPKSATTEERFQALKKLRSLGFFGGVMATPLIPGIGDNYENMRALAKEAKRANAEFIVFGGMTLKPGRQKDLFLRVVKHKFPEHLDFITRIYALNNKYGNPDYSVKKVRSMLRGYEVCKEVGISDRSVRHKIPFEHDVNNLVLGKILDILFYQRYLLGMRKSELQPHSDLAIRLERGVENLNELRDNGNLQSRLLVDDELLSQITQIMDTGSCDKLAKIHEMIQEQVEMQRVIET